MLPRALFSLLAGLFAVYAQTHDLALNQPIERTLSGSDRHVYTVTLQPGQFAHVVVDQKGVDVAVRVLAPDGAQLLDVDSPNGTEGTEVVEFQAKAGGVFRIEVRGVDPQAKEGRYSASLRELLSADEYAARLGQARQREALVRSWLSANAVRLRGAEPGQGFEDMQPLKKIIGKARVVAMGEATHGTREFFQLKSRMLEFLATELNFNVFAIEATMPEAFDLNHYVLTGQGDPAKLLSGLYFWTWDTEEVLQMIRWMRRYNEDPLHPRKLKFYGFDMQVAPRAVKVALAYLQGIDQAEARRLGGLLRLLENPFTAQNYTFWPPARKEQMAVAVRALCKALDEHPGGPDWRIARQHARVAQQFVESPGLNDMIGALNARDRAMADNIRWILDQEGPDAKVVVWAHNGHVARKSEGGVEWMGSRLAKSLGANLVIFGFAFNRGKFQAVEVGRGLRHFSVPAAPDGSLDAMLRASGIGTAAVDLRSMPAGPVREWFQTPRATRSIGAVFDDSQATTLGPEQVLEVYDAIFFVDRTTAARANPGGAQPSSEKQAHPRNLDFESSDPLEGWTSPTSRNSGFVTGVTTEDAASGKKAAFVVREPGFWPGEFAGQVMQRIDAAPFRGKRIRLKGSVRTTVKDDDSGAHLWLRVERESPMAAPLFFEDMADRPIRTAEWREFEIECTVPQRAERISFGLALTGTGRALLDRVSIEVVER
jgi:erythromycin esterase